MLRDMSPVRMNPLTLCAVCIYVSASMNATAKRSFLSLNCHMKIWRKRERERNAFISVKLLVKTLEEMV